MREVLAAQPWTTGAVVGFVVLSVALALMLGSILASSILHPVRKMDAALERIAQGDFVTLDDVVNRDELGALVNNLNRTSRQLSELYAKERQTAQVLEEQLASVRAHPGPAPSGAEDGGGGPTGRRRGPRLQQSPDRHHRPGRPPAHGAPRRRSEAARYRLDHADGGSRIRAHPAAPGLEPQAGAAASHPRPERARGESRAHPPAPHRRAHRAARAACRRRGGGQRGPDPDRTGPPQSDRERARRDADGRHAHHRALPGPGWTASIRRG